MSVTTSPEAPPRSADPEPAQPRRSLVSARLRNPWGQPRFLVAGTWGYIAWALVPVAIAILFSFNAGRSRSVWQGFSIKWWWGDPTQSIFHDSAYTHALVHSLLLAGLDMVIATPLGVLLALGSTTSWSPSTCPRTRRPRPSPCSCTPTPAEGRARRR
jgi:ABC-type phosphate/phosphonate transport system permease subunit